MEPLTIGAIIALWLASQKKKGTPGTLTTTAGKIASAASNLNGPAGRDAALKIQSLLKSEGERLGLIFQAGPPSILAGTALIPDLAILDGLVSSWDGLDANLKTAYLTQPPDPAALSEMQRCIVTILEYYSMLAQERAFLENQDAIRAQLPDLLKRCHFTYIASTDPANTNVPPTDYLLYTPPFIPFKTTTVPAAGETIYSFPGYDDSKTVFYKSRGYNAAPNLNYTESIQVPTTDVDRALWALQAAEADLLGIGWEPANAAQRAAALATQASASSILKSQIAAIEKMILDTEAQIAQIDKNIASTQAALDAKAAVSSYFPTSSYTPPSTIQPVSPVTALQQQKANLENYIVTLKQRILNLAGQTVANFIVTWTKTIDGLGYPVGDFGAGVKTTFIDATQSTMRWQLNKFPNGTAGGWYSHFGMTYIGQDLQKLGQQKDNIKACQLLYNTIMTSEKINAHDVVELQQRLAAWSTAVLKRASVYYGIFYVWVNFFNKQPPYVVYVDDVTDQNNPAVNGGIDPGWLAAVHAREACGMLPAIWDKINDIDTRTAIAKSWEDAVKAGFARGLALWYPQAAATWNAVKASDPALYAQVMDEYNAPSPATAA